MSSSTLHASERVSRPRVSGWEKETERERERARERERERGRMLTRPLAETSTPYIQ